LAKAEPDHPPEAPVADIDAVADIIGQAPAITLSPRSRQKATADGETLDPLAND
jgi:hypothetical protein